MNHDLYGPLLDHIVRNCRPLTTQGTTASYIPELQKADAGHLGVCIATSGGEAAWAGEASVPFTIQSISKMLVFTCSLLDNELDRVLQTVSVEPTADSFNSIGNLETKNFNRPLNPMINSGAIACLTLVDGDTPLGKFHRVLDFARSVSGNPMVDINQNVYLSEKETGSRNRALAYYMKSTGVLDGDVEALMDAYFRICAIEMDCRDLARTALVYANNGLDMDTGDVLFPKKMARMVKAVITLCGMYDESGSVAVNIGLPSKSGVGGGILSIVPHRMGIGIYGPALNEKGTSTAGLAALKMLAKDLDLSIF